MPPNEVKGRPLAGPALNTDSTAKSRTIQAPSTDLTTIITLADAERLTTRIQLRLEKIADNIEAVLSLIEQARAGNVHEVLGYRSWTEYVADRFGGTLTRISKAERLPIVELLAGQGMSTRAIATVVGVSQSTIRDDVKVSRDYSPEPARRFDLDKAVTNGIAATEHATVTPVVTGIDGKSYTRPGRAAPRKRPLPDQARDAGWDLYKSAERIQRILADDRLPANREQVCHALRGRLRGTRDMVRDALDLLPRDEAGLEDPYEAAVGDLDAAVQRFWRVPPDEAFGSDEINRQHLEVLAAALAQVADDLAEWWAAC